MHDPLVLIPGLGCDARLFEAQMRRLGRDRVLVLALPTQADRIEDMAARLLAQLPPRFALAGHCLGGAVALEILRQAPDRVSRLAILSVGALGDTSEGAAGRDLLIARARGGRLDAALDEALPDAALAHGPARPGLRRLVQEMGQGLGVETFVQQQRAMQRRPDQQVTLRQARLPALFIYGEEDGMVPAGRNALLAELLPGARIMVLSGAGHLPSLERPDSVSEAMEHWLYGHGSQLRRQGA